MGCYVNPLDCEKEEWLLEKGDIVDDAGGAPDWSDTPEGQLPVCLVNNGPFLAAAVAYNESEIRAFNDPSDYRPRLWFFVDIEDLKTVSDVERYI